MGFFDGYPVNGDDYYYDPYEGQWEPPESAQEHHVTLAWFVTAPDGVKVTNTDWAVITLPSGRKVHMHARHVVEYVNNGVKIPTWIGIRNDFQLATHEIVHPGKALYKTTLKGKNLHYGYCPKCSGLIRIRDVLATRPRATPAKVAAKPQAKKPRRSRPKQFARARGSRRKSKSRGSAPRK